MKSPSWNKIHYFDYNATHPPFEEFLEEATKEYLREYFNPSGITRYSLANQSKIEQVRKLIQRQIQMPDKDIIFSATGTEANYLMIQGIRTLYPELNSVYVSPFEHASMYAALSFFGFQVDLLPTTKNGTISLSALQSKLEAEPKPLVCLLAGNETGVIQPAREIHTLLKEYESPWFSDLMQAYGKISISYEYFAGVTFSGHKIGAGPGSAVTILPKSSKNIQLFGGGFQENNHRAGTENVPAILSLGKTSEFQLEHLTEKNERLQIFRTKIETKFKEWGAEVIAESSNRLPNTSFLLLPIDSIDFFLVGLEEARVLVSTGSSCKSRAREASTSLLRMGYSEEEALRAIRISTGYFTTEEDVKILLEESGLLLKKLRSLTL